MFLNPEASAIDNAVTSFTCIVNVAVAVCGVALESVMVTV